VSERAAGRREDEGYEAEGERSARRGAHVASGDEAGGRRGGGGGEDVAGAERRRASHDRRHLGSGAVRRGSVEDDEITGGGPT
jgi:hypothetical protein